MQEKGEGRDRTSEEKLVEKSVLKLQMENNCFSATEQKQRSGN